MRKFFFSTAIFFIVILNAAAQDFQTLNYFDFDSISLELDLFLPTSESANPTPLVIYVHGGGFKNGNRNGGHGLARHLIEQNIACASITYTLYMKDKSFSCDGILSEKIKAIQIAASQLWNATAFLLDQKEKINIDTAKIFIAGSSAGAETVLHAAYWDRKQMQLFEHNLSNEFKYAGIISGAGAIMDLNLITEGNMLPTMLFHGDADPTVPYATAAHHYCPPNSSGWLMLFGSKSIADYLGKLNGIFQMTTFKNGKHSFAGAYFYQNQNHVSDFIDRVLEGDRFMKFISVPPEVDK